MHCLQLQNTRRKNKQGTKAMFQFNIWLILMDHTPLTSSHTVDMTLMDPTPLSPVCSSCQKPRYVCVLSVLMRTPAETQQTHHNTFSLFFLKMADRGKQEQFYLKFVASVRVCGVCSSVTKGKECFVLSLSLRTPDIYQSCCTQLYYQSSGHVVHCKILYIERILLCILAACKPYTN